MFMPIDYLLAKDVSDSTISTYVLSVMQSTGMLMMSDQIVLILLWNYSVTTILYISFLHKIFQYIGRLARMSVLDTDVDGSNPGNSMLYP